jgi:hypothetical protein
VAYAHQIELSAYEAAKHLIKTSTQTSAKAKDLAGRRIGSNCESVAAKSYSICLSSSYRQGGGLRSAQGQICTLPL